MIDPQKLETLAEYPLEFILPFIGFGKTKLTLKTEYGLFTVKTNSVRLECIKRNNSCVFCKKEGIIWHLNCFDNFRNPHLNLYHIMPDKSLMMITLDHIRPISKGGKTHISNSQSLCRKCNENKGDKYPYP